MEIDAQHIREPGLVVLDITAADEATARAVMEDLQQWWPRPASLPYAVTPERQGSGRVCTPTSDAPAP